MEIKRYINIRIRILMTLVFCENLNVQYNLYYPTLLGEEQLVQIIEGSDNRMAKITGLNGIGRVGLRSDN